MIMVCSIFDYDEVIVECSGKIFEINMVFIQNYPNTLLYGIVNRDDKHVLAHNYPIRNGRHIIKLERDPVMFGMVVEFYRKGKLYVPCEYNYQQVCDEFDFFNISVDNLVFPKDLNKYWILKCKKIQQSKQIVDSFLTTDWFAKKIENNTSFNWIIGDEQIEHSDYYTVFNDQYVQEYLVNYLKEQYNISISWVTIVKYKIQQDLFYIFPKELVNAEDDVTMEIPMDTNNILRAGSLNAMRFTINLSTKDVHV